MSARLFIAVALGDEDRRTVVAWAREAVGGDRGMRVVAAEQVHLTLAFLGHRPLDEVGPLDEVVEQLRGWPAPVLSTGAALWLSPRRPHVLTIEVLDPAGALGLLQASISAALVDAIGYEPERRPFRPHITVARVRRGASPRRHGLPGAPGARFAGEAVTLYRSWLGGGPARYEPLERVTL
jgi:2'-5' RNA ligase